MATITDSVDECEKVVKFYLDEAGKLLEGNPSALDGCEVRLYAEHEVSVEYKGAVLFSADTSQNSARIPETGSLVGPQGFLPLRFKDNNFVVVVENGGGRSKHNAALDFEKKKSEFLSASNTPWLRKVATEDYIISLKKEIDDWYNRPWYKKLLGLK